MDIPVIANGDVVDTESAKLCLEATNAGGLMIGRGAIGRPTIFHEIKQEWVGMTNQLHGEMAVLRERGVGVGTGT